MDLTAGAMSEEQSYLCPPRQGSCGFASQLFSSLTKLKDRNSFVLLRCICLCGTMWDCGICLCSFHWAPPPGFLWADICSDWGEPLGNIASCIAQVLTCKHHRCAEVSGFVRVSEPASLRSLCFVSLWVSCVDAFAYMENVVIIFSPSPAPVPFALLALGHFQLNGACQGQPSAVGLGANTPHLHLRYFLPQACLGGGQGIGAFFPIFFFSWYLITSNRQTVGS